MTEKERASRIVKLHNLIEAYVQLKDPNAKSRAPPKQYQDALNIDDMEAYQEEQPRE